MQLTDRVPARFARLLAIGADPGDDERARTLAVASADDEMMIATLNNLARTKGELGDDVAAVALLQRALDACRRIGDRHREAALLSNLGDAQFALGEAAEAAASVKESALIMAQIGMEGERFIPEVWKLSEW
jgi:tetratricopeptide (TPR) repeat protein